MISPFFTLAFLAPAVILAGSSTSYNPTAQFVFPTTGSTVYTNIGIPLNIQFKFYNSDANPSGPCWGACIPTSYNLTINLISSGNSSVVHHLFSQDYLAVNGGFNPVQGGCIGASPTVGKQTTYLYLPSSVLGSSTNNSGSYKLALTMSSTDWSAGGISAGSETLSLTSGAFIVQRGSSTTPGGSFLAESSFTSYGESPTNQITWWQCYSTLSTSLGWTYNSYSGTNIKNGVWGNPGQIVTFTSP